jgi:hypothetical protein
MFIYYLEEIHKEVYTKICLSLLIDVPEIATRNYHASGYNFSAIKNNENRKA